MSSPIIPIFVGSFGESVGSSISLVILSDAEPATVPAIILVVLPDATEVEAAVVASPVGVKENQEKDKIGSKPDKKREAW
nr:hypothetical protein [Tanacetum cinerariifolium]